MSEIVVGEMFPPSLPEFMLTLPDDIALIWRETPHGAQALLWAPDVILPRSWSEQSTPWKIIGQYEVIRELWARKLPPLGSRSIITKKCARVCIDLKGSSLKWQGIRQKRMVIVDDSPTMRKLLRKVISSFTDWEVIGELDSAEKLPEFLDLHFPDLITLDLNLTGMDGVGALRNYISQRRVPTLVITSQPKEDGGQVMEALSSGAIDYIQKPESGKWDLLAEELESKMNEALKSKWSTNLSRSIWRPIAEDFYPGDYLIAIGSSTGGTLALQEIFLKLPQRIPPILVTQHIPAVFSKALAARLNELCPFEIKEAEDGDEILPNRILIAPGGKHMRLCSSGKNIQIDDDAPINRFKPSVDALFYSVAQYARSPAIGVILTGMGKDGAQGLKKMRDKGATTIAQDESTSVVFGMPREAIAIGAATRVERLQDIPEVLVKLTKKYAIRKSS
jgi:two-component system, chemotaxis family, protein-glutamate methylesterase/glutaminase